VEDSKDNRFLVQAYLKSTPYQVDIAENGEVGVHKFTTGKYDLVLMDLQMPVMDGYTATKAIREWESGQATKPTPIIALSASALVEAVQRSLEAGCTDHVTKPVKKSLLLEIIDKYTSNGIESPIPTAERNDTVAEVPKGQSAFNLDAALSLLEGDVGLLKDMAALFFEVAPDRLSEIREAITQRDSATLERAAHTLKGSVNNFRAVNAFGVASRLEEMARHGDFTNAKAASVELEKEIACLKDALTTLTEEVLA
jgi:CheY-like chemotaxis protein